VAVTSPSFTDWLGDVASFVSTCSTVRKISDERVRVRMTSQAEGMRFIIKVCMSEISQCESSLSEDWL
jgi:hypothetical protein